MTNNLNHDTATLKLLTNKRSLVVVVLTLFLIVFDIGTRLSNDVSNKNKHTVTPHFNELKLPKLSQNVITQLKDVYSDYSTKQDNTQKVNGMSAEEQAKQQGKLTRLFIDNNQISLTAVIKSVTEQSHYYVLLTVINIDSGESSLEKFNHNDNVYGYLLTIEKNTQIKLIKHNGLKTQEIHLTMYK